MARWLRRPRGRTMESAAVGLYGQRVGDEPSNVVRPVVTTDGTPHSGETISASNGTWTGGPSFTYQWYRLDSLLAGTSALGMTVAQEHAAVGAVKLPALVNENGPINTFTGAIAKAGVAIGTVGVVQQIYTDVETVIARTDTALNPPAYPHHTTPGTALVASDNFDQSAGSLIGKAPAVGGTWAGGGDAADFTVDATNHRATRTATGDVSFQNGHFALSGALLASDNFDQTTGNLNGKVATLGGTWTEGGAPTGNFTVNAANHWITRSQAADPIGLANGRVALCGPSAASSLVSADVLQPAWASGNSDISGIAARYINSTNWVQAGLFTNDIGDSVFWVFVLVANVLVFEQTLAIPTYTPNTWDTITVSINAAGQGSAWINPRGDAPGSADVTFSHSSLATGGALATGRAGIYDWHLGSSTALRQWDNFRLLDSATATLSDPNPANLVVSTDVMLPTAPATGNAVGGPVARYNLLSGFNSFVTALLTQSLGFPTTLLVNTYLNGSVIGEVVPAPELEYTPGTWVTITLSVDVNGLVRAWINAQGVPLGTPVASYTLTQLATGGALANGRSGFVDVNTSPTTLTRSYDNFRATTGTGTGGWVTSDVSGWQVGFMPGMFWQAYARTGAQAWRTRAETWQAPILTQTTFDNQDLGFMFNESLVRGYELVGTTAWRTAALTAATTVSNRYNATVGAVKSWDWNVPATFNTIVDSVMNMQLLFWAARNGAANAATLYARALSHLNKVRANHVRANGSTVHVVDYSTSTGLKVNEWSQAGVSAASCWTRGQAWAILGFARAYPEVLKANPTDAANFLATAKQLATFFLNSLPVDKICPWDFSAPDLGVKDSSAAAIAARGLIEIAKWDQTSDWRGEAREILTVLASTSYSDDPTAAFAVLKHGVSVFPTGSGIDVGLPQGDYYYVDALDVLRTTTSSFGEPIVGATASTYLLTTDDVGTSVRCVVTGTNVFGSEPAASDLAGTIT